MFFTKDEDKNFMFISLSPGKILLHRTVRLTKLPQGKQRIPDHIRSSLFVDLNAEALHFQTD